MKFSFGFLLEVLEASFHLPRLKKLFDSLFRFLNRGFEVRIDHFLSLEQLDHNGRRLSVIFVIHHFFRLPFSGQGSLGCWPVNHTVHSLAPTFLRFGQRSIFTRRGVVGIPMLVAWFRWFKGALVG